MAGLILRGRSWFARLYIPEDRWTDVGRALKARNGIKREVVRTLGVGNKRDALKALPNALAVIRADVDKALIAAKLRPLTDWTASWHERAVEIRADLDTRGHAVAGWVWEPDGTAEPVFRHEGIRDATLWEAEEVASHQGRPAAEQFLKVAFSEGLTIGMAKRQWIEDEARRVKPTTIVSHEGAMAKLAGYLRDARGVQSLDAAEFSDVSRVMAGEFIRQRRKESAAATVQREFSAYSGLWRWAIRRGYTEVNPWSDQLAGLKTMRPDETSGAERAFTTVELLTLLRAGPDELAPNRGALAPTFWDAIRVALLTGVRTSELLDMTVSGVIEDGTAIAVAADPKRTGKTKSASRIVPLHPIARRVLTDRLASLSDRSPDAPLWPEIPPGGANNSRGKTFATRFVILRRRLLGESDEVDWHSLRRSWMTAAETAMHAEGSRVNDAMVALLGGHKRGSLALDLYSDWTRLGRPHMAGKLADKLATLRTAMDDIVALGMPAEVLAVLEETAETRPPVVRVAPAFKRP